MESLFETCPAIMMQFMQADGNKMLKIIGFISYDHD